MKKDIFGILVVCAVASCLGEAVNSRSYTLDVTFEDPNESVVKFDKDSLSTLNEYGVIMWLDPSLALLYKQKDIQVVPPQRRGQWETQQAAD